MVVYLLVTQDEYELPLVVADTVGELARIVGVNEYTIRSSISRVKNGLRNTSIYQAVDIGDDDLGGIIMCKEKIDKNIHKCKNCGVEYYSTKPEFKCMKCGYVNKEEVKTK